MKATSNSKTEARQSLPRHPFGELLAQHRARKPGLTQTRLAELAGYDQSILVRMSQGKKDLTGPSGRERAVRLIETLAEQGALTTMDEANALLLAADMPPLFERQPSEARLITRLSRMPAGQRTRRTNLPAPLTSFIGRAHEIAEVRRLLSLTRLLTLTGAGGCGKTRLAQRVAADVLISYTEGVWYAELAALTDSTLIADLVVRALGLMASDRPAVEQLNDFLRERQILLVLDNCEHLIEAVALFALEVLRACPRVTILTTSREALNVDGEMAWRVPPMQPDEAGRLFVDRALAVRSGTVLSSQDDTVAHICQRLDGMPLAIELAAARLSALSVSDIAARLDDRFNLLGHGRRGALPRHQTLRALIDWSYELLSEPEKVVFRRLGVFVGGWEVEDTQEVIGDDVIPGNHMIILLSQLVSKSLISLREYRGASRYYLLETIREYALEKLNESGELRNVLHNHAEVFATLAERAEPHIRDKAQRFWVQRLESSHDNIRAVLSWSLSGVGDAQIGLRLVSHMWQFWWISYIMEGVSWLRKVLDATRFESDAFLRGRAWLGYGSLLLATATPMEVKSALDEAMQLLNSVNDVEGVTFGLYILGCCRDFQNDERVRALVQEGWAFERWQGNQLGLEWAVYMCARHTYWVHNDPQLTQRLAVAQEAIKFSLLYGDMQTFALASFDISMVELYRMNLESARVKAIQAIEWAQAVGACWEESAATSLLSEILQLLGSAEQAQQYVAKWFELAERFDWPDKFKVRAFTVLGRLARDRGNYTEALRHFRKVIEITEPNWNSPTGLEGLSCICSVSGEHEKAAQLLGLSEAIRQHQNDIWWKKDKLDFGPYHLKARAALGDAAYEAAYAEGRAMPLEQAIAYSLS